MLTIEEILKFMQEYGPAKTVDTYQFMVIQRGDPLLIYQFMKNIPGCDKTLLRQIISDFLYYDENDKSRDELLFNKEMYAKYQARKTDQSHDLNRKGRS